MNQGDYEEGQFGKKNVMVAVMNGNVMRGRIEEMI